MAIYLYSPPNNDEIVKEVFQSMSEPHVYSENGVVWVRVWTVPQASVDASIDPFSEQAFMDKTGKKNGTMGDLWKRSEELSQKRASKRDGKDPIRAKFLKEYRAKRKNKPHLSEIREAAAKTYTI